MRRFRSLLIDHADVRVPGLTVKSLVLHRHLAEHASVEPHRHPWCQALLYLSSRGVQWVDGVPVAIEAGSLVLLPPGVAHAFQRTDRRAPLCLVINFQARGARSLAPAMCSLNRSSLAEVRQHLARLIHWQATNSPLFEWDGAVVVLQTLLSLMRAAGWLVRPTSPAGPEWKMRGLHRMLDTMALDAPLGEVVARSGYQRDHLNRLVKRETGLSLGQFRARRRLARAKELLGRGVTVAAVAGEVGLPDQAYFARWFRRQTGQTPTAWARQKPAQGNQTGNLGGLAALTFPSVT